VVVVGQHEMMYIDERAPRYRHSETAEPGDDKRD
jgi:hypothetical protein